MSWKIYKEKPEEIEALEVCEENLPDLKNTKGISFGEVLKDGNGDFDGITVIENGKTRKKISKGDFLIKVGRGCEKRNRDEFIKKWEE